MEKALAYARENEDFHLGSLKEILRIPSVSADPKYAKDITHCAEWVEKQLFFVGFPTVKTFTSPIGHPIVYGEWIVDPAKPTLLIYGHYDVQPADPVKEDWQTPPFDPVVKDGKIYARGANDNKGQFIAHMNAIEAYAKTYGAPPVNIKFIIEGEEECGGAHLEAFVGKNQRLLAADVACVSDTDIGPSIEVPCLTYGLRGIVYFEVTVRVAERDMHSGVYGGVVPNPFHILARLISETKGSNGRIRIPGFYDNVHSPTEKERALMKTAPFNERKFLESAGAYCAAGEVPFSMLEWIGFRPTFEVHGMPGGYIDEGTKTVIPAQASAKMSMRLVPDQDPEAIMALVEKWIVGNTPRGVEMTLALRGSGKPWRANADDPVYEKARDAFKAGFGAKKTGTLYAGGSVPVVPMIAETLKCPVVMMGLGLETDGLHAPNEHFGLDRFFGGTRTMIHFYNALAQR